jgi:hypothetical protein
VLEIQPHRLRCTWRDDWPAPTELQLELQAEGAANPRARSGATDGRLLRVPRRRRNALHVPRRRLMLPSVPRLLRASPLS